MLKSVYNSGFLGSGKSEPPNTTPRSAANQNSSRRSDIQTIYADESDSNTETAGHCPPVFVLDKKTETNDGSITLEEDDEIGIAAKAALERYKLRQEKSRDKAAQRDMVMQAPTPTQSANVNPRDSVLPTSQHEKPIHPYNPNHVKPTDKQTKPPESQPDLLSLGPHCIQPPSRSTPPLLTHTPPPPTSPTDPASTWSDNLLSTTSIYKKPPFATRLVTYGILPTNSIIYLSPRPYRILPNPHPTHTTPIPANIHKTLTLHLLDLISLTPRTLVVISSERVEMAAKVEDTFAGCGIKHKVYLYVSYQWDKQRLTLMEMSDGDEDDFEEYRNDVPLGAGSGFRRAIERMEGEGVDQIWVRVAEWEEGGVVEVVEVGVWNGWAVLDSEMRVEEDFDEVGVVGLGVPKVKPRRGAVMMAVERGVEAVTGGTVEELVEKVKELPVRETVRETAQQVGGFVERVKENPVVERAMEKVADKLVDVKDYINEKARDVIG